MLPCQLPQQKTDCESRWESDGYGGKKWVEVPSTCQQNTYDNCRDVQKQKLVQVKSRSMCSLFVVSSHILDRVTNYSPGSLHRLPKCAPAAVPASSRAAMPTGALHSVPAGEIILVKDFLIQRQPGLRGCAPEDPSEDKPDCAKENLWRRRSSFPASCP